MFSLSEGERQQPPKLTAISTVEGGSGTCCCSTCGCSGDRHPCLPRCVVEGCSRSARVVSGRGIGGGTCSSAGDRGYCFPQYVGGGRPGRPLLQMEQRH